MLQLPPHSDSIYETPEQDVARPTFEEAMDYISQHAAGRLEFLRQDFASSHAECLELVTGEYDVADDARTLARAKECRLRWRALLEAWVEDEINDWMGSGEGALAGYGEGGGR